MKIELTNGAAPRDLFPYGNRELHVALAQHIANTKGSEHERQAWLGRIFSRLTPWAQVKCRLEIAAVKAAKRGETLAELAA